MDRYTHGQKRKEKTSQKPRRIFQKGWPSDDNLGRSRLTASAARDILTAAALLSTRESNTLPGPVRAATTATQNVDVGGRAADATRNTIDGKARNGDAGGGGTSRTAVLVVLLDDDAVFGDAGECDVLVGYAGDGAGGAIDGLDANTWLYII